MRKALEVILKIIVIIISISALLFMFDKALEGQEQIDCYRLQKQSKITETLCIHQQILVDSISLKHKKKCAISTT